jgi:hypothetical protein
MVLAARPQLSKLTDHSRQTVIHLTDYDQLSIGIASYLRRARLLIMSYTRPGVPTTT